MYVPCNKETLDVSLQIVKLKINDTRIKIIQIQIINASKNAIFMYSEETVSCQQKKKKK